MSNGAAGCGWEYRDMLNNWKCVFLEANQQLFGIEFSCKKYNEKLETQRNTRDPFRCSKCSEGAGNWHDSIAEAQRLEELKKKATSIIS